MSISTENRVSEGIQLAVPSVQVKKESAGRLLSVDFLRGFIMVLLALESAGLYEGLTRNSTGSFSLFLLNQFTHHPWHGLHFWDLVQPVFMFIAGTAMAFSLRKQKSVLTWNQSFAKILKRSAWLFFWGVTDYLVRKNHLSFELWDVLTQLAFTTLVAFLVADLAIGWQLGVSVFCLLLPEFLYRFMHMPGFDQPFTDQHNFGNYMDLVLMHKINDGGWVAINCISTSAHTVWGLMAGQLLLGKDKGLEKVFKLVLAATILLILGFGLDLTGITPIIKKIATSSFVLASGGYCLLFLAVCYWWIDVLKHQKHLEFFTIVGMNSIFIYLFFEIVGDRWFTAYVTLICTGFLTLASVSSGITAMLSALCVVALEWGLCYFLYRKKIFFKL